MSAEPVAVRRVPAGTRLRLPGLALALALAGTGAGCQAGYVLEQGASQIGLVWRSVPIGPELLESLPAEKRRKMSWVPRILEFGREALELDPGRSYERYLETHGQPVTHAVVASHPLALIPYQWCFPIVGCVPYKGFFAPEDALEEAAELRAEGWDVEVFPVEAYSTLGWFRDPLISTMLDRPLPALVDLILHETTHRTLYVPGWASFNESLATHIAYEGTKRFLALHPDAATAEEAAAYEREHRARLQDVELVARLRDDLDALYRSFLPPEAKVRRKQEVLRTAARAIAELHPGTEPRAFSNAFVLSSERYHEHLRALARIQQDLGGSPAALMAFLERTYEEEPEMLETLLVRESG